VSVALSAALSVTWAVRGFTLALGAAGVLWGLWWLPQFQQAAPVEDVASRVVQGHAFRLERLHELVPDLDAIERQERCRSASIRSSAIIRLRIAEVTAAQPDGAEIDKRYAEARSAIRKALECNPGDSFLWLSLYWLEVTTNGFRSQHLELLRMSYRQGPNEGWIMEKRSQLALAAYRALPADLAELALAEFTKLLQPEYCNSAVRIFAGAGWPIRDVLLARIANVPDAWRRMFAQILQSRGIEVEVPGVVSRRP
jgi:hypothetical protein